MAIHRNRAQVRTSDGRRQISIPKNEALDKIQAGQFQPARPVAGGQLEISPRERNLKSRWTPRVVASITAGDMRAYTEAVIEKRKNIALVKIKAWPKVHDTFNVTIVAGRVF